MQANTLYTFVIWFNYGLISIAGWQQEIEAARDADNHRQLIRMKKEQKTKQEATINRIKAKVIEQS